MTRTLATALACCLLIACQAAMYRAYESVGIEKRDILLNRVEGARDAQTAAKEQFTSALDRFRALVEVENQDLEATYDRLSAEFDRSKQRAETVHSRIDAVESVAEDLFREWQTELEDYSSASRRASSERLLRDTRQRYAGLIRTMRQAEGTMEPVLQSFEDSVLTLKHNLNAQAVQSLRSELRRIERETSTLNADMERSIREADRFIAGMRPAAS